MTFSDEIEKVDTVRAYHVGSPESDDGGRDQWLTSATYPERTGLLCRSRRGDGREHSALEGA